MNDQPVRSSFPQAVNDFGDLFFPDCRNTPRSLMNYFTPLPRKSAGPPRADITNVSIVRKCPELLEKTFEFVQITVV